VTERTISVEMLSGNVLWQSRIVPTMTVRSVKQHIEVLTGWCYLYLDLCFGVQRLEDAALVQDLPGDVVRLYVMRNHGQITVQTVQDEGGDVWDMFHDTVRVLSSTAIQELLDQSVVRTGLMPGGQILMVRSDQYHEALNHHARILRELARSIRDAPVSQVVGLTEQLVNAADDLVMAAKGGGRGR
jgi:hypothetical protein